MEPAQIYAEMESIESESVKIYFGSQLNEFVYREWVFDMDIYLIWFRWSNNSTKYLVGWLIGACSMIKRAHKRNGERERKIEVDGECHY